MTENYQNIESHLEESGPQKIKPFIEISKDKTSADIVIPQHPQVVDVEDLLKEADVVYGVDSELVSTINKSLYDGLKLNERYQIARGKKPVFGQAGELILRTSKPENVILSSEDLTQVDYRVYKQKLLSLAEAEKPTAMIIAPTKGHDGMNVHGEPVPGADGEEVKLILGSNAYQQGRKVMSKIDGLIEYKKERDGTIYFDVSEIYLVKENVDYSTGNIDFPGSVIVKGIIKAGFEVKAKNEVVADTIRGKVIAGGSVVAKQGIIGGSHKADIEAGGSVYAKFVQGANINSGDCVIIKKSIFNSEIFAEDSIRVEGSPGTVVGGSLFAVNFIEAKVFGSESYAKTELALYSSAKSVKTLRELINKRFNISKNLLRIDAYLGNNRDLVSSSATEDKRELINNLIKKRDLLRKDLLEKNSELKKLQAKLTVPIDGRIVINKEIWPEVRVAVSGKFILVKELAKKGYFFFNKDEGIIEYKS
ncbi:MAG: hypothetical protein C0603_05760 [Denitrovibrio sp.]|nr:MAG: hypothetical protein C0603_05760 [Denitrovibrio sp.]